MAKKSITFQKLEANDAWRLFNYQIAASEFSVDRLHGTRIARPAMDSIYKENQNQWSRTRDSLSFHAVFIILCAQYNLTFQQFTSGFHACFASND